MEPMELLKTPDWPEVYGLMVRRNFPDVPPTLEAAVPFLNGARVFGFRDATGQLAVVWVLGEDDDGVAFLDVVCAPCWQGRWATRARLRELYRLIFEKLNLRCVWVQPKSRVALRAALAAGFVPGTPLDMEAPILLMTPFSTPKKWMPMLVKM